MFTLKILYNILSDLSDYRVPKTRQDLDYQYVLDRLDKSLSVYTKELNDSVHRAKKKSDGKL